MYQGLNFHFDEATELLRATRGAIRQARNCPSGGKN